MWFFLGIYTIVRIYEQYTKIMLDTAYKAQFRYTNNRYLFIITQIGCYKTE